MISSFLGSKNESICLAFEGTRVPSVSFYKTKHYSDIMSVHATATDLSSTSALSPYAKFKMALKSKEVKRQYPNLLERFLDFCKFEGLLVFSN